MTARSRVSRWVISVGFSVLENGRPRPIGQFTSDAVPISLLVAIDISGSMQGPRFERARMAILRLVDHLNSQDEVSLYAFNDTTRRLANWTSEKVATINELRSVTPSGGTALY